MNTSERAIYRDLLDHCYEAGSIPDNRVILARLASVSLEEFDGAWTAVGRKFEPHPDQPGRLINPRVLSETTKRASKVSAGKTGGVKSGETRAKHLIEAPASENSEAPSGHKKRKKNTTLEEKENEQQKIKLSCASEARVSDGDSFSLVEPEGKQPHQCDAWFSEFWEVYKPIRSRARKAALKAFTKIVRSEAMFQAVMAGLRQQTAELLSKSPEHRPYASSWLNGARYEDEIGEVVSNIPAASGGAIERALDIFEAQRKDAA